MIGLKFEPGKTSYKSEWWWLDDKSTNFSAAPSAWESPGCVANAAWIHFRPLGRDPDLRVPAAHSNQGLGGAKDLHPISMRTEMDRWNPLKRMLHLIPYPFETPGENMISSDQHHEIVIHGFGPSPIDYQKYEQISTARFNYWRVSNLPCWMALDRQDNFKDFDLARTSRCTKPNFARAGQLREAGDDWWWRLWFSKLGSNFLTGTQGAA